MAVPVCLAKGAAALDKVPTPPKVSPQLIQVLMHLQRTVTLLCATRLLKASLFWYTPDDVPFGILVITLAAGVIFCSEFDLLPR